MKTLLNFTLIAGLLIICIKDAQAQSAESKPDQVELMKQFIGSWKSEWTKDSTVFWDAKTYGTGFESSFKLVTQGKTIVEGKQLWGYDKVVDKFIIAEMVKGGDIQLYAEWFVSKSRYVMSYYKDISNPEMASWKIEGEFKSPDMFVETIIVNNKSTKTNTYKREKW
jgi:hypothetical protein